MKTSSFTLGLALALSVSVAAAASAQTAQRPDRARGAQSDSGFRRGAGGPGARGQRGGGPEAMLLRGITLSENQKARLQELRTSERKQFDTQRPRDGAAQRPDMAQRQRRDTTGMGARRGQMEQRREQRFAAIRSILDGRQRSQFDKNVAELKAHAPGARGQKVGHEHD